MSSSNGLGIITTNEPRIMYYDPEYDMWFENHPFEDGMSDEPPKPEDDFWGVHGGKFFVCWFSKRFWDIHDYHHDIEPDTPPMHFHTYTCRYCGKKFTI